MLSIYWNPDPVCFRIPVWGHPVVWYGLFFAIGFFLGFLVFKFTFLKFIKSNYSFSNSKAEAINNEVADLLIWYVFIGTLVGARLGHVFFYNWPLYRDNLFDIFKIWEGGLASHGGAIGVFIGLGLAYFKVRRWLPSFKFLSLLDHIVVPAALAGSFIRIGNFFNQELLGVESDLPWAVVFGSPFDGSPAMARHPAQLYESLFYFLTFILLLFLGRKKIRRGILSGLFFIMIFGFRFMVEFVKDVDSLLLSRESYFSMGQYLSIPFIVFGFFLIFISLRRSYDRNTGKKR